jgi:hypothetical protein
MAAVALLLINGCATEHHHKRQTNSARSETVLVTYHVKPGQEPELEATLHRAWHVYRQDGLVYSKPHVIVRDTEDGKPRYIEIFTWIDRRTPEHAPPVVTEIWKNEESFCEKRGGHYGIEPGEVRLVSEGGKRHD